MPTSPNFWNRIADKYAARPVADQAAYERKLAETRKRLTPDMRLLEFGCGTGTTALIHAPNVKSIEAIDFSERMIEICREKAAAKGIENVSFRVESIETLEAEPESFDMVLGMSILHLVPDYKRAITKVATLVKPGGYFITSTACLGNMFLPMRWLLALAGRSGVIPQLTIFSANTLAANIEAAGFVVEERWKPKSGAAVFIIAKRPAPSGV